MSKLDTKNKILAAAKQLFVDYGYSGSSVGDIAKLAGVNKSLIYHHFGSKDQLWQQTKASVTEGCADLDFSLSADWGLRQVIDSLVRTRCELYSKNPDLHRIIAWQKLEGTQGAELLGGSAAAPDRWTPVLRELQKKGEIRSDLDIDILPGLMTGMISGALEAKSETKSVAIEACIDCLYRMLHSEKSR